MMKILDIVTISKYKNILVKGYVPSWSEEIFLITKVKNTVPWTYDISDLIREEIVGAFYERKFKKVNQEEVRVEKVIKREGDKLCIKWKGYDDSFKSWIDKKEVA